MTGSERQHLRALIDQRVRALTLDGPCCSSCGTPADLRTVGCRTCTNRHLRRKWSHDPAYIERRRQEDRARKRRRRAAA